MDTCASTRVVSSWIVRRISAQASRQALFARWPHQHQRQVPEFRYEVPEDLWKYWAI